MKVYNQYIDNLLRKLLILRIAESMLIITAICFLGITLASLVKFSAGIPLVLTAVLGAWRYVGIRRTTTADEIATYLNKNYPQLEFSADLLNTADHSLTSIQKLQKVNAEKILAGLLPGVKLPVRMKRSVTIFVVLISAALIVFLIPESGASEVSTSEQGATEDKLPAVLPADIRKVTIRVAPPGYTGLGTNESESLNITVPQGSSLAWSVDFSATVRNAAVVLSGGDTIRLQTGKFSGSKKFAHSAFYHVTWTGPDNRSLSSDFYRIEITEDKAPGIDVRNLGQFTETNYDEKLVFPIEVNLSDDYGLSDAVITATVSKGSGESVKFREVQLRFSTPANIVGRNITAGRNIDLRALGLEPGDELYFYVAAKDIRTPVPNTARTETYFISIRDTAALDLAIDGGLGVDLMPEYFRSQRQIIIDTEKLLREKRLIAKEEFNARSNELGFDQKVLRLKYGEFLGEEFESGMTETQSHDEETEGHEEVEDVTKRFGHVHDEEGEHDHQHEEERPANEHKHELHADGEAADDPLAQFYHVHDDPEEATFFIQSIRTRLKAALSIMWDAELHLRLYMPEKSLPYQYQALRILKEISNDSRIYVHKTGLDAPPVKEDRRLTGDLSEARSSDRSKSETRHRSFPAVRQTIPYVNLAIERNDPGIVPLNVLAKASQEIAVEALEKPGELLATLSLLKRMADRSVSDAISLDDLRRIRRDFLSVIDTAPATAGQGKATTPMLESVFLDNINRGRQ